MFRNPMRSRYIAIHISATPWRNDDVPARNPDGDVDEERKGGGQAFAAAIRAITACAKV